MRAQVITYHLEMTGPGELRPVLDPRPDFDVRQAKIPCPELNRFLYTAVGGDWLWVDRLGWTYDRWLAWVERPELATWVAYLSGTPAGYFELEAQPDDNVEIAYFGLLPRFIGRKLGGVLLTAATERAWASGAARVWVHTCSLDHPQALANYLARGFRIFKEETSYVDLPDRAPGPWPGAR